MDEHRRPPGGADEREVTAAEALGLIGVGDGAAATDAVARDVHIEEEEETEEEGEREEEDDDEGLSEDEGAASGGEEDDDGSDRGRDGDDDEMGEQKEEASEGEDEGMDGGGDDGEGEDGESDGDDNRGNAGGDGKRDGGQKEKEIDGRRDLDVPFVPLFPRKQTPPLAALYAEHDAAVHNKQTSKAKLIVAQIALEEAKRRVAIAEAEDVQRQADLDGVRRRVWAAELEEPCKWNTRLAELRAYREEHGNADVPYEKHVKKGDKYYGLALFGKRVRDMYSNGKLKQHPHRLRALESLGFRWKKVQLSLMVDQRIEKLRAFREKHGHCVATRRVHGESMYRLMIHLRNQLQDYREGRKRKYVSTLTDRQAAALKELFGDANWSKQSRSRLCAISFDERMEQFLEFRRKTGHCVPPDQKMRSWVGKARSLRKGWVLANGGGGDNTADGAGGKPQKIPKLCSRNKITEEQIRTLDEAGFCWTACKCPGAPPRDERRNSEACLVPASVRKKEQDERAAEKARAEERERLEKLKNPPRRGYWGGVHRWDRGIKMLKAYKRRHGNCYGIRRLQNEPHSHPVNYLNKFLLEARKDAALLRQGMEPRTRLKLTPDRLQKLLSILGGDYFVSSNTMVYRKRKIKTTKPPPATFEQHLETFQLHRKNTGHCDVNNREVRLWITAAREQHRQLQPSGEMPETSRPRKFRFTPDQLEKLTKSGLCWTIPCSCPTAPRGNTGTATEAACAHQHELYEDRLEELRLFKEKNGHTKPSVMKPSLAKFMREVVQDGLKRRGQGLKAKTAAMEEFLTKERVLLLAKIFSAEKTPAVEQDTQSGRDGNEPGATGTSGNKDCATSRAADEKDARHGKQGSKDHAASRAGDKTDTSRQDTRDEKECDDTQSASYKKRMRKTEEESNDAKLDIEVKRKWV